MRVEGRGRPREGRSRWSPEGHRLLPEARHTHLPARPDPLVSQPPTTHVHAPAHPCPVQVREPSAVVEHEASTSKIGEDQLFYFRQRGVAAEEAVGMIISGFCREVFNELPLEFAAEVNELMNLKLEGTVG